jgi:hypothetical protein
MKSRKPLFSSNPTPVTPGGTNRTTQSSPSVAQSSQVSQSLQTPQDALTSEQVRIGGLPSTVGQNQTLGGGLLSARVAQSKAATTKPRRGRGRTKALRPMPLETLTQQARRPAVRTAMRQVLSLQSRLQQVLGAPRDG